MALQLYEKGSAYMGSTAEPVTATTTLFLPDGGELEAALVRRGGAWSIEVEWPLAQREAIAQHLPITWGTIIENRNRCETATKLGIDLPRAIAHVRGVLGTIQDLPPTAYWFTTGPEAGDQAALRFEDIDPQWHWQLVIGRYEPAPFAIGDAEMLAYMAALRESSLCSKVSFMPTLVLNGTDVEFVVELTPDAAADYLGTMATLASLYADVSSK